MADSLIQRAKEKLDVPALWRLRKWPGEPGRECLRPYAPEDRRKSGSVFEEGQLFKDFKSGDVFDAPALLAAVENMSNGDACKLFIKLANVSPDRDTANQRRRSKAPKPEPHKRPEREERKKPTLPALRSPEPEELDQIAELRGVSPRGVELAANRELLFACHWHGAECWALTDSAGWNAQFRRFDGLPFDHAGGPKKTLGIAGGWAAWPIGAATLEERRNVLLVEGTGDFIAAHSFAYLEGVEKETAVVCVTGASVRLPWEALRLFRERRIRIFPHLDKSGAGEAGALRWELQLEAAGAAHVECYDFFGIETEAGEPVEDLNDLHEAPAATLEALGSIAAF